MIRAVFTIQCDVCGELFEQLRMSQKPDPGEWALSAGDLNCTASMDGWYFNSHTRKHWCMDCLVDLQGSSSQAQLEQIF
jgi:hypothetical protein